MAGPSGINPNTQLNAQISAAQQFANVNIGKKEATGKQVKDPAEKQLDLEDKPELSTFAGAKTVQDQLDILDTVTIPQEQQEQAQQEAGQTGFAGAAGREAAKQDQKEKPRAGFESRESGGGGHAAHAKGGESTGVRHTMADDEQQQTDADASGDAAADEKTLQKSRQRRSAQGMGSTDLLSDSHEAFAGEREIEGAFVAAVSGTPETDPLHSKVDSNVEAQKISATYLFATEPGAYPVPVNAGSIDTIFSAQNPKAVHALPMARGLELSPVAAHVDPLLEPKGKYTPLVMFEESGTHGGNIEYGTGAEVA